MVVECLLRQTELRPREETHDVLAEPVMGSRIAAI